MTFMFRGTYVYYNSTLILKGSDDLELYRPNGARPYEHVSSPAGVQAGLRDEPAHEAGGSNDEGPALCLARKATQHSHGFCASFLQLLLVKGRQRWDRLRLRM